MRRGLMLMAVLSVLGAGVASAAVQQGQTEISATAAWFTENGREGFPDIDVFFLTAALGYFLTDNIEVAPAVTALVIDEQDVSNTSLWAVGAQAKYHFMPTNQLVPYVGGQFFWAIADNAEDADGILWGPLAGVRFELNATNDVFAEFQYHIWSGDIHDVLDQGFGIFAGIVHQFK